MASNGNHCQHLQDDIVVCPKCDIHLGEIIELYPHAFNFCPTCGFQFLSSFCSKCDKTAKSGSKASTSKIVSFDSSVKDNAVNDTRDPQRLLNRGKSASLTIQRLRQKKPCHFKSKCRHGLSCDFFHTPEEQEFFKSRKERKQKGTSLSSMFS